MALSCIVGGIVDGSDCGGAVAQPLALGQALRKRCDDILTCVATMEGGMMTEVGAF